MRSESDRDRKRFYSKSKLKNKNKNSSNFHYELITIQNSLNLLRDDVNMLYFLFTQLLYLARCSLPIFNGSIVSQSNFN